MFHAPLLWLCLTLQPHEAQSPRLCQGIFQPRDPTRRLLCLPHCRQILNYWSTREAQDIYTFKQKRTVSQSLVIIYNFFDLSPCQLSINTCYFSESITFYFIEVTRHLKRLLYWIYERKKKSEVTQSCPTLLPHGLYPTRLLRPWDSPGKNTGVGCHFLLQGNLPDPRIELESPALQTDTLPSEPPGTYT